MGSRLVILSYFHILLMVSQIRLCTVNIVLLTFLYCRLKKNMKIVLYVVFQGLKHFFNFFHKSSGKYKQLIQGFEIIHTSHLFLSLLKDAKILPLSLLIALFLLFWLLPCWTIFHAAKKYKAILSQKNMHNDTEHISIYLTVSQIKSNYSF